MIFYLLICAIKLIRLVSEVITKMEMKNRATYKRKKPGTSPGSLVYVGEQKIQNVKMYLFDFNRDLFEEKDIENVEEIFKYKKNGNITWINIDGVHDTTIIKKIGEYFDIHSLILEDILDTSHRPKIDDMEHYIYISLKMLTVDPITQKIGQEQVGIILGDDYILSFQESAEGDVFNPIRERLRTGKGRMRKLGADYFAYCLLDAVIDNYFLVVESIGERIESLDQEIIVNPSKTTLPKVHNLKNELIKLRKAVWPLRDIVSTLERSESPLFKESTEIYIKDLYDHSVQIIDTIETYRDLVSGLFDIYLSSVSNKTNDVMKVLTMMASIFIPLTFIVGVYGMNFKYFPELEWQYGYAMVWVLMIGVAGSLWIYFKKKGWT